MALVIAGAPPITNDCWACGAGVFALPAWLASITQLPGAVKLTVSPVRLQTPVEPEATERTTGFPDPPPVAVSVTEVPTTPAGAR